MLRKFRSTPSCVRTPATLTAAFWQHFFDVNSLTAKLKQAALRSFSVHVQQQGLALQYRAYVWQRQVHLCVDDVVWIEANVSIPLATLQQQAQHLLYLRNKPIGEYLFRDPQLQRGAFTLHWVPYAEHASIPQRRCDMYYRHSRIALSEIFYPPAIEYFSNKTQ